MFELSEDVMAKKELKTPKPIDPRMEQIGAHIKKLRIEAGYTNYEEFAWKHEIGRMQYYRMESGKHNFTFSSLFKVVDAHDLSIKVFFEKLDE